MNNDELSVPLGPVLRVLSLNIEGASKTKCQILQKMAEDHAVHIIHIQETHIKNPEELLTRLSIPGYNAVESIFHDKYGISTLVLDSLPPAKVLHKSDADNLEVIVIKVCGTNLVNVYKPPAVTWPNPPLPEYDNTSIYMGDFNSHHNDFGYSHNDVNGNIIHDWILLNQYSLILSLKDPKTFHAHNTSGTNPDLCIINEVETVESTKRQVFKGFPHSHHSPVLLSFGISIPIVQSLPENRWNFKKADWKNFADRLDAALVDVSATPANYQVFVDLVYKAAKKSIPRGYRRSYIPGWDEECTNLYELFNATGDRNAADALIERLNINRSKIWHDKTMNMDFTHSSRKAWNTIQKLGVNPKAHSKKQFPVSANDIATKLLENSKADMSKSRIKKVMHEFRGIKKTLRPDWNYSKKFTLRELRIALNYVKPGKAAGYDKMYPEFLLNCGLRAKKWICTLISRIVHTGKIPPLMMKTTVIAILKPGKDGTDPTHFRPISLLSVTYNLLERLILERIQLKINTIIPIEQAGFRKDRGCNEQMLAFSTFVESGFQSHLKSFIVQLDLSAAYDTVWKYCLMVKFGRVIQCSRLFRLLMNMLSNRMFQVKFGDKTSRWRILNNGLPQGSVLAPTLFNLYTHDLPKTVSQKFIYADDITLAYQCKSFEETELVLQKDLEIMSKYFKSWRLKLNLSKTEVSTFHLNNQLANRELNIQLNNTALNHNFNPKILGITFDRTLSFRNHLETKAKKLATRINLIQQLAGTTWGANANTLRTAAMSLVFTTAEYCCPVWLMSAHCYKINVQLNRAMRIISGTIKSTPLPWLPVLTNIPPPDLRRKMFLVRTIQTSMALNNSLLCQLISDPVEQCLVRKPPYIMAQELISSGYDVNGAWCDLWTSSNLDNGELILEPFVKVPGFDLPREIWTKLNRIRTGHGRCNNTLHLWGSLDDPGCDCGFAIQDIRHIVLQKQFLLFALRNLPWSDPYMRPPYEARLNLLNIDSLADRRTAAACAFMRNYLTDSSIVPIQSPTICNRATNTRSAVNGAFRQLATTRAYEI